MIAYRAIVALVSLTAVLPGQVVDSTSQSEKSEVLRVILEFIAARNAHDGERAAATYFADGEYIDASGKAIKGRSALAKLWSGAGVVPRSITDIQIVSKNIALAKIEARFSGETWLVVGRETFLLIKDDGEWRIRVHQRH